MELFFNQAWHLGSGGRRNLDECYWAKSRKERAQNAEDERSAGYRQSRAVQTQINYGRLGAVCVPGNGTGNKDMSGVSSIETSRKASTTSGVEASRIETSRNDASRNNASRIQASRKQRSRIKTSTSRLESVKSTGIRAAGKGASGIEAESISTNLLDQQQAGARQQHFRAAAVSRYVGYGGIVKMPSGVDWVRGGSGIEIMNGPGVQQSVRDGQV